MRSYFPSRVQETSDDTETTEISSYEDTSTEEEASCENTSSDETASSDGRVANRRSRRIIIRRVQPIRRARLPVLKKVERVPVYGRKCKPGIRIDSDDSSSSCVGRRKTTGYSQNVGQRRGRNASFEDRSGKRKMRRRAVPSMSVPLPRENANEDSDEQGFEIIDEAEFRKMTNSSKARLSTNNYEDYENEVEEVDEDVFMFHSTSNIGPSKMKQQLYKGNNDEDSDSEGPPFQKIDKVDFEYGKRFFTRRNGGWDAVNSPHLRSKIYRESVNDNITGRQREELISGVTSRTRAKMMSVKKTAGVGKAAMGLSDKSPSSDSGYDSSGGDDSGVNIVYVSDINDSLSSYSEKYVKQDTIMIEESTKKSENCYGMERNSNTYVGISADDEPKKCEKQKVPSSKENGEKEDEINKAPEENHEINTIFVDKATPEEGLQVNNNGEREGGSPKHVSNEHCNQEKEKECHKAASEKRKVPLCKKQNGEKAREINESSEKNKEINTVCANEKLHVKNNVIRKKSTTAPYSKKSRAPKDSSVAEGVSRLPFKNQALSDKSKQAKAVSPGLTGDRLQAKTDGIGKNSPAAPCSNQSHLAKNSSGAEELNRLQSPNKSRSNMGTQAKAGSPAVAEDKDTDCIDNPVQKKTNEANLGSNVNEETVTTEDKDCDYTDGVRKQTDEGIADNVETPAADEIEKRRKLTSSGHRNLFKMLADSVLERAPLIESESDDESNQAPINTPQVTLPLKFRFEDEMPKKAEKMEYEMMVADLFDELNLALAMEQGSSKFPEANSESECSPTEETQDARCARGFHELTVEDDEGLYCIYCRHVELDARDILPQWVENARRKPGRKRSADTEEFPEFGERFVESSMNNDADFNSIDDVGTVWNVKPRVRESMYKHQQEGFEFLWKNLAGSTDIAEVKNPKPNEVGGCIISHAPGTGKTRLTIVFIETYLKVFPDCRPVIIAPASMLLTWEEEFKKWDFPFPFHNLNNIESVENESKEFPKQFRGPKCQDMDTIRMIKIFLWNKGGSILGISYSLFEKLSGEKQVKDNKNKKSEAKFSDERTENLRRILLEKPGLVILDEGHTPRNKKSNIWNALLKLKTEKRVILSGTPFQNNFGELFNTLRLVRPAMANVIAEDRTFALTSRPRKGNKRKHDQSGPISEVIDGAMLEKLKSIMSPFVNVHKGTILRESLPGLRDSVILLKPQELQKSLIETLEGHQSTFEFEHKVALISVHPYLLKYCGSPEKRKNLGIDNNLGEASKLNPNEGTKTKFIIELLRLSTAANEKVLIFSQYIQPLELIQEQLKEVFKWVEGKQILRMQGKLYQKQRQNLINIYNNPLSEARVMLASTRCCSEGISLVGASRVVLLDVVWNPSVERQAICRAYRIGQKKFVHTYHLMTSGTTEGDKYCRQAEKERLSELVFCSSYGESDKKKNQAAGCIEDKILEQMIGSAKFTDMFEKILNQPKETDLIQTFGLTS